MLLENKEQEKEFISTFQNPFESDKVEKIDFEIENYSWNKCIKYSSRIRFCSGDTTGYHKIKADNFIQLINLTEQFIQSL